MQTRYREREDDSVPGQDDVSCIVKFCQALQYFPILK